MRLPSRILVAVDFSQGARVALDRAMTLAREFGASVDVLHVWQPPSYVVPEMLVTAPEGNGLRFDDYMRSRTLHDLSILVAPYREATPSLQVRLVAENGSPRELIVAVAKDKGADLIVVGTHGYTGMKRFVLGSIAEGVVRTASCPVLVVRDEEVLHDARA